MLQEDGREEAVPLPSPSFSWRAEDISVSSALQGPLPDAMGGPSRLLQVTDDGVVTAAGLRQTPEGTDLLTGRALVLCTDTRIGEKQQADISVVVPTALRLLYEETEELQSQPLWKQAAAAAAAGSSSDRAAEGAATGAEKALLLRHLLLAEEPQLDGGARIDVSLPPLRLSAAPASQRGAEGPVYLVQGREYLFKAELLAEGEHSSSGQGDLSKVLLPSNAVLHWTCEKPLQNLSEDREGGPRCPLEKTVSSQQVNLPS